MPQFGCRCGFVLHLSEIPNEHEHLLVPDTTVEEIADYVGTGDGDMEKYYDLIDARSKPVIICPECGRLWLSSDPESRVYESYFKEKE